MTREERIAELEKQISALPTYDGGGLLGIPGPDELQRSSEERSRLLEELNREKAVLNLEQKAERAEEILKASMRLVQSQEDRNAGVITLNELVGLIVKEACKTKPSFPTDEYWSFYSAQSKEVKAVVMQALVSHQLTPRKRGSLLPVAIGDSDWPTDAVVKRLEAWEWLSTIGAAVPVGLVDEITVQRQAIGENSPKFATRYTHHSEEESTPVEAERRVGWYDYTMAARTWFGMQNVAPKEAAMLLCRLNPFENLDPERTYPDDDEAWPDRYHVLLRVFEDVASTTPKQRTLMEWKSIAQERGLRYHPWIDEYLEAMGSVFEMVGGEVPPATGKDAAQPVIGPLCTKKEIIDGFILTAKKWDDILTRPDREGRRYREAFKQPGRRGQGGAALFSPIVMARLLITNRDLNAGQVKARFMKVETWRQWEAEMLAEIGES